MTNIKISPEKITKTLLIFVVLVFFISGCGLLQIFKTEQSRETDLNDYFAGEVIKKFINEETDDYVIDIEYPEFVLNNNKPADDVNALVTDWINDQVTEFKANIETNTNLPETDAKHLLAVRYSIYKLTEELLSFNFFVNYNYLWVAHDGTEYKVINYDLLNKKEIGLEDVFDVDYQEKLSVIIWQKLAELLEEEDLRDSKEIITKESLANFNISDNNLVFSFGKCEVLACAAGPGQVVEISHMDLIDILNFNNSSMFYIFKDKSVFCRKEGNEYKYYTIEDKQISATGLNTPTQCIIAPNNSYVIYIYESMLYYANIDGSGIEILAAPEWKPPHGMITDAYWSDDSQKIIYHESIGSETWSSQRVYEYDLNTKEIILLEEEDFNHEGNFKDSKNDKVITDEDLGLSFSYAEFNVEPKYLGPNEEQIKLNQGKQISGTNPPIFKTITFNDENNNIVFAVDFVNFQPDSGDHKISNLQVLHDSLWGCGNQFDDLIDKKISDINKELEFVSIWQKDLIGDRNIVYSCILNNDGYVIKFYTKDEQSSHNELEQRLIKILKTVELR